MSSNKKRKIRLHISSKVEIFLEKYNVLKRSFRDFLLLKKKLHHDTSLCAMKTKNCKQGENDDNKCLPSTTNKNFILTCSAQSWWDVCSKLKRKQKKKGSEQKSTWIPISAQIRGNNCKQKADEVTATTVTPVPSPINA